MAFYRKIWKQFLGPPPTPPPPPRPRARVTQLSLTFHIIGIESYCNGVQPSLSEMPGSAPEFKVIHIYTHGNKITARKLRTRWAEREKCSKLSMQGSQPKRIPKHSCIIDPECYSAVTMYTFLIAFAGILLYRGSVPYILLLLLPGHCIFIVSAGNIVILRTVISEFHCKTQTRWSWVVRAGFPAFSVIASSFDWTMDALRPLWLAGVITLVRVLRHSFEICSKQKVIIRDSINYYQC